MPIVDTDRRWEMGLETAGKLAVSVVRLLMQQHSRRIRRERVVVDRTCERGPGRRPLEPELRNERGNIAPVGGVVEVVPDIPDVHRAVSRIVGWQAVGERVRRSGAVWPRRVELGDDRRQDVGVIAPTPGLIAEVLLPAPVLVAPDVLVVAIPQREAGMRTQPG